MSAKDSVRRFTRSRLGLDFGNWAFTPAARRVHMWEHYGITTLVDVGANIGQYATEARKAGYDGTITSFEPVADVFATLQSAASADPLWETHQIALGARRDTLTMHLSEGSIFSSPLQVLDDAVSASPDARQIATEEVTVAPLDELMPSHTLASLSWSCRRDLSTTVRCS